MGLDITWYKKLTKANGNEAFDETGELKYDEGWIQLYINPDFDGRADDIDSGCAYKCDDSGSFRAGSYGGYNGWRNELAKISGFDSANDAWEHEGEYPFMELICFSDCEGVIGAEVSKKLAADFEEHQDKADLHEDRWFKQLYSEWRKAFVMASDGGAVEFH